MNRLSESARAAITSMPRVTSSRQSPGSGSRSSRFDRLPAIDLIGASELFSSWPSTRMSRCHAWRSSSRRGWLTSEITTSSCGRPPCRNALRLSAQRPVPPGNVAGMMRGTLAVRHSSSPSSSARRSSRRSMGWRSRWLPARLTNWRRRSSSNVKTATSISSMTLRSSVVASRAPRRWLRSVSTSALTSIITSPSGSPPRAPRARMEKSPSPRAASRFESVCSGTTTRSRSANANPRQTVTMSTVRVHWTFGV